MSFCPYCGKELSPEEGSAKFCAYCGKPLNVEATPTDVSPAEEAPVADETPAYDATPVAAPSAGNQIADVCNNIIEKLKAIPALAGILEKIDKKFYPAVLAAPIAVIILALILVIGIFSADTHMSPLNDFLNQVNRKVASEEKLSGSLMADFRYNLAKKAANAAKKIDDFQDNIDANNDSLEAHFDEIDDEFDSWKISFDKKSEKKLDKDDLEELQDELDDFYDDYVEPQLDYYEEVLGDEDRLENYADMLDADEKLTKDLLKAYIKYFESYEDVKITEGYQVKGKFIVKADGDEYKTETVKLFFVKLNGDWVYAGYEGRLVIEDTDDLFDFIMAYLKTNYTKEF